MSEKFNRDVIFEHEENHKVNLVPTRVVGMTPKRGHDYDNPKFYKGMSNAKDVFTYTLGFFSEDVDIFKDIGVDLLTVHDQVWLDIIFKLNAGRSYDLPIDEVISKGKLFGELETFLMDEFDYFNDGHAYDSSVTDVLWAEMFLREVRIYVDKPAKIYYPVGEQLNLAYYSPTVQLSQTYQYRASLETPTRPVTPDDYADHDDYLMDNLDDRVVDPNGVFTFNSDIKPIRSTPYVKGNFFDMTVQRYEQWLENYISQK